MDTLHYPLLNHPNLQEYQLTHPMAQVNGILKGSYYLTISDQSTVTCRGGEGSSKLRALIDYKDEVCSILTCTPRQLLYASESNTAFTSPLMEIQELS
jgi:hypothetical protein